MKKSVRRGVKRQVKNNSIYNSGKKNEKGLSTVITTLLIIMLIFVLIGIIWVVVKNLISTQSEEVFLGKFTLDLEIAQIKIINDTDLSVTIKRNPGEGNISGIMLIFYDGKNSEISKHSLSMEELEERNFEIALSVINTSLIRKISVAPIFKLDSGKEIVGDVKDESSVNSIKSSGGGGTSGGSTCTEDCISLGYECGIHTICEESVDCGPCAIPCELTSAFWNMTGPVIAGTPVRLNIAGTNCEGKTITFEILEKDGFLNSDDSVASSLNIIFSEANSYFLWNTIFQDDTDLGQSNPPEYYFTASVYETTESITSSNEGVNDPLLLTVTQSITCGDGTCNGAENCSSCPGDCGCSSGYECSSLGNCDALCDLTSAYWNMTGPVIAGTPVRLNIAGTNCEGKTITFEILEKDSWPGVDDAVITNPSNTVFSGVTSYITWMSEWQEDNFPEGDPPEYYFNATVNGKSESITSSNSGVGDSALLRVTQPITCGANGCQIGETCSNCPTDCGNCAPVCGDGSCNANENCTNCSTDCGICPPVCGDGSCNGADTCSNCPSDCGVCPPVCGDGSCNGADTCSNCPADCGICPPVCGDGSCNGADTCSNCPADCGVCQLSGCVMYLSFNEGSGTTVQDSCGNNNGVLDINMNGNCFFELSVNRTIPLNRQSLNVGDGQSFVAEHDSLISVDFASGGAEVIGTACVLELRDGWNGNILGQAFSPGPYPENGYRPLFSRFFFVSPVHLTVGNTYYIVASTIACISEEPVFYSLLDEYSQGVAKRGGVLVNNDWHFRVVYDNICESPWKSGAECKSGNCLEFNGIEDFVQIADSSSLNPDEITVMTWVYGPDSQEISSGGEAIIGKNMDTSNITYGGYHLGSTADASPRVIFNIQSLGYQNSFPSWVSGISNVKDLEWHHIAGTYDGETSRVYVDGVLEGTETIFSGPIRDYNIPLRIGRTGTGYARWYRGKIDEVKIYNRSLSAQEICQEAGKIWQGSSCI